MVKKKVEELVWESRPLNYKEEMILEFEREVI